MLRGLYDFTPISPKTLGFKIHEQLLFLSGVDRDENWLRVSNCAGQIGLVPVNYVDVDPDLDVTGAGVIDFLDESLQVARRANSPFLQQLQQIRRSILNPTNDLQSRLSHFHALISHLKAKGSPFCNQIQIQNQNQIQNQKSKPKPVSKTQSQEEVVDCASSFLTCDHQSHTPAASKTLNQRQRQRRSGTQFESSRTSPSSFSLKSTPRPMSGSGSRSSSRTRIKKTQSSTLIQYVSPDDDNESVLGERVPPIIISDDGLSCVSSHTYTCPTQFKNKSSKTNLKNSKSPTPNSKANQNQGTDDSFEQRQVCEIIEKVRQSTGISHEICQKAVHVVLNYLHQENSEDAGDCASNIKLYLRQLQSPTRIHQSASFIRSSADFSKLRLVLGELSLQAQEDDLWETGQNQKQGASLVEELKWILNGADERVIVQALEEDSYKNVHCLALYYQKQRSWRSRKHLIEAFAKMAAIDLKALSVLLNSVLPLELAREMRDSRNLNEMELEDGDKRRSKSKREKTNRVEIAGSLLGLLLSTGEKLPVRHLEVLGRDFITFILDTMDSCTKSGSDYSEEDGELPSVLLNLLLAYNLQFGSHDENLLIATLASRRNAKFLTQKTVHLLLWEQDPVAIVNQGQGQGQNQGQCPDSVLKLVLEMFSCSMVADLFYTNDTKVLIDIVVRSLTDWEPGNPRRTLYLQLMRMIMRNTNFRDHNHRRDDLVKIFTSILLEEDPLAVPDHRLIREITNEFPTLLKSL